MTDSQYIGYKLKNDATIQGYVGSGSSARVFHGFVPETVTAYPVINYFVISYQNFDTRMDRAHYQISVRSKNPEEVKKIAYAIEILFATKQENVDDFDCNNIWWDATNLLMEDKDVYHISIDLYLSFIHE